MLVGYSVFDQIATHGQSVLFEFLYREFPPSSGLNVCMSGSATSCEECILIHPSCAWCAQEVRADCCCHRFAQLLKNPTLKCSVTERWSVTRGSPIAEFLYYTHSDAQLLTAGFLISLQDFGRVRCDLAQSLQNRGCKDQFIEFPISQTSVLKSNPLSSKGSAPSQNEVTQIMPQKISVSLRPGRLSAPIHPSLEPHTQNPTEPPVPKHHGSPPQGLLPQSSRLSLQRAVPEPFLY